MAQVLIVDDDQTLRNLLRGVLEEEGYQVTEAAEGATALDFLRRSPHRFVVLLDYLMPSVGGKQVLHVVSQDAVCLPVMPLCYSRPAGAFRCR